MCTIPRLEAGETVTLCNLDGTQSTKVFSDAQMIPHTTAVPPGTCTRFLGAPAIGTNGDDTVFVFEG